MNWYLTKMVFRIICGDGNHTAQFDEQLRLVTAGSKEEAFHKAQLMGMHEEEMFFNQQLQLVQWQFISVSELYQLNQLIDGLRFTAGSKNRKTRTVICILFSKKPSISGLATPWKS